MRPAQQPAENPGDSPHKAPLAQVGVFGMIKKAIGKALLGHQEASVPTVEEEREALIRQFQEAQIPLFQNDAGKLARALCEMGVPERAYFDISDVGRFFAVNCEVYHENVGLQIWDLSQVNEEFPGGMVARLAKKHPEDTAIVCSACKPGERVETPEGPLSPMDNSRPGVERVSLLFYDVACRRIPFLVLRKSTLAPFLAGLAKLDARNGLAPASAA